MAWLGLESELGPGFRTKVSDYVRVLHSYRSFLGAIGLYVILRSFAKF